MNDILTEINIQHINGSNFCTGGTPERAEFEASIDLSATEDDRQIMDEDEWTDLNFGTSTNLDTSDDSLSDLDTDSELQVRFLELSKTAFGNFEAKVWLKLDLWGQKEEGGVN